MTDENTSEPTQQAQRPAPVPRTYRLRALFAAALFGAAIASLVALAVVGVREGAHPQVAAKQEAPAERWQCPMHPSIIRDHPGKCPICGMELVKIEPGTPADAGTSAPIVGDLTTVTIDPARQQLIGLETAEAVSGEVGRRWRTVGRVAVDETRVRHVNVKFSGFVEEVFVDFIGKPVRKGQPMFRIYSPELYAAQEEYLLALRTKNGLAGGALARNGDDLLTSARKKLELWDISPADLDHLEKTGVASKTLTLYAPISGVVTKKDVVDGMKLDAGAMPYEIVDLAEVWVLADVYESELRHVRVGMPATLTLKAFPNETFAGRVAFINPLLDPTTRTVKVRIAFPNKTGELRPEMFGEVTLEAPSRQGLRIPADAVIDSGTRSIVFVALGAGKFQPRDVGLGDSDGAYVEVVSGLSAGERVVTRANFLVDSESRLRASLSAMSGPSGHAGHGARADAGPAEEAPGASSDHSGHGEGQAAHEGHGR